MPIATHNDPIQSCTRYPRNCVVIYRYLLYLHREITRFIRNLPTVSSNKSKTVVGGEIALENHCVRGRFLARMHDREEIQHRDTDEIPADTRDVKGEKEVDRALLSILLAFHVRTDINRERTKNRDIRWRLHSLLNYEGVLLNHAR